MSWNDYVLSSGVTKLNFDRIEIGMKIDDVKAILGMPIFIPRWNLHKWQGDNGATILVQFVDGAVVHKEWQDSTESLLDKFRRWLQL